MDKREIENLYRAYPRQVYSILDTSARGLSAQEVEDRKAKYGPNRLEKAESTPVWKVFLKNFISPMAILLWVAGLLSLVGSFLGEATSESFGPVKDPQMLYLAIAIWLVNIVNGLFSFFQEFRAGKATDALERMLPSYARVIRDGEETRIPSEDLVPGDIVILSEGDRISADCRILLSDDLSCSQSALDGEATPARKNSLPLKEDPDTVAGAAHLVFAGTSVATGTARCAVYATGMNTEFGRIASLTRSIQPKRSSLQDEIARTTKVISTIALVIGAIVFVLGVMVNGTKSSFGDVSMYLQQFVFALGMITAFIPEGLSPTVTLSLAKAVQRMAKKGALIKSLNSVETLGSTTVICSDKTGTLTKNEMTVKAIYMDGKVYEVTGDGYGPEGEIKDPSGERVTSMESRTLKMLLTAGALCSDARIIPPDPGDADGRYTVLGDPTEACLAVSAEKGLVSAGGMQTILPRLRELNFDSSRKLMTTIHQIDEPIDDCQRIAFTKGAPKELLERCTSIMDRGTVRPLTPEDRAQIMSQNDSFAAGGLRVLGMAYRLLPRSAEDLPVALSDYTPENIERNLVFLGLQAMQDPPREGIAESIAECHRAGIRVIMITGDYGITARAIAKKIGIIDSSSSVRIITGQELCSMDDADLRGALEGEVIFARMAPEQKYRVVSCLQDLGHTVAVTGDGVNDAPALRKADIGVAMGVAGTDVAKDAADMVLTDDNFASIVEAVKEGRTVFSNLKRFITYIFNSNIPEAIPFLLPLLTYGAVPQPLTIMEVLFIDLGTDLIPALGLGIESAEDGIMDRPPRPRDQHLIDARLLKRAGLYGLQTTILALGAYFLFCLFESQRLGIGYTLFDSESYPDIWRSSTSVVLASIVLSQIGVGLSVRADGSVIKKGIFSNRLLTAGIVIEIGLLALVIYTPWLNEEIFQAGGIYSWRIWLILLCYPVLIFGESELYKLMRDRREARRRAS